MASAIVKFRPTWNSSMEYPCSVHYSSYAHGGTTAMLLVDAETGEVIVYASVNIEDYPLKDGQILIKNWSENAGVLEALVEAGIVRDTGKVVPTGYVVANLCDLLVTEDQYRELLEAHYATENV